ncbi:hypothetical protein HMPREF9098_0242 [Kingella denitrificans ATCC 33394]|uniref:Uncharacterized protein n=1 Tax=Kingella denitrificans ATCC 33394 TaxID=888741 RepID=F0EWK6_9NEIS|nr:hypothetical protein HMPREF9098_0242 [Kingella denitrificans ATCC 33394]
MGIPRHGLDAFPTTHFSSNTISEINPNTRQLTYRYNQKQPALSF